MTQENLTATGKLEIIVLDESGNIKNTMFVPNMIVSVGKAFIINRMTTSPPTAMSHMALGINDAPTSTTMTGMVSEALNSGAKIRSAVTTTTSENSITYSATFPANTPSVSITIKEAGIFNSVTNGTMLARTTFGAIQKLTSDVIVINWTITIN